jgi:hypothetical protein
MTASAWPSGLPQNVLISGYQEGVGDGLLEYQPETGPTISRLRTSSSARPLTVNFELTSAQIAILRTFYGTTLLGGSLPFTFPGVTESATYLVKFQKSGIPKWTSLGGDYYSVTMSVWILP